MRFSVADVFPAFSTRFEGSVSSMYCDVLGLITTGIGCLIDPVVMALTLPWRHGQAGELATQSEIAAAWHELKAQRDKFAKLHFRYAAQLNDLRLSDDAIGDLLRSRLAADETVLRGYFAKWDSFPADAQLACCSMAWAVGAGWPHIFTNCARAINAGDWVSAALCCDIKTEGNAGVVPRNTQNRLAFTNAAVVQSKGLPLERLYWPISPLQSEPPKESPNVA
jgi:hypothetical protein